MSQEEELNTPEAKALRRAKQGLMPIEDQEIFDRIVGTNPEAFSEDDKIFLRARRSYLTHDQERIFDSILKEETPKPTGEDDKNEGKEDDKKELSYPQLQGKASSLGMPKVVGASKTELEEFIAEAEKKA